MQVKAHARFIRMSARKVRLVVDLIRGAHVSKAQTQLRFANKAAAEPVLKLLNSAIANATNNFHLNKDDLVISSISVDEGPTLDRFQPRAHGRAMPIRKRSSHIHVVLENVEVVKEPKEAKTKKAKINSKDKIVTPKTN
ncbi:MAG: 50S ribosomal protein L22 [Patescibacteria group bacterium]